MPINLPDVLSSLQNHHIAQKANDIALYEIKAQVYFQTKKYFEYPFNYRTAYQQICDIPPSFCRLSKEDIEKLEFDIEHLFSENVLIRYKELRAILAEIKNIDFELGELFSAIQDGEPERYFQIKEALLSDEYTETSEKLLDNLEICFVTPQPERRREVYNYRELESEYEEQKEQYIAGINALLDEMESEIAYC